MSKKDFIRGVEAAAKANEAFMKKQAEATEELGKRIVQKIDEQGEIIDVVLDTLNNLEKKELYDLQNAYDIKGLGENEKEVLASVLLTLISKYGQDSEDQKDYYFAVKKHLGVAEVSSDFDLSLIENVDSRSELKAIFYTVCEFLFLKSGDTSFLDEFEEEIGYFGLSRKTICEIVEPIEKVYELLGLRGIAEHYGSTKKVTIVQNCNITKADLNLREKAEESYLKYDIGSAFSLFNVLAEQGDGRSYYFLGQIYEHGFYNVVKKDDKKAGELFKEGMKLGDPLCAIRVAHNTETLKEENMIAEEWFDALLSLAQSEDIFAMYEVAFAYDSLDSKQDEEQSIYWYDQAAEAGHWGAMLDVGLRCYNNKQYDKAVAWFQKSADIGLPTSWWNLSICYRYGKGVLVDKNKADQLEKIAAEKGESTALSKLGKECISSEEYAEARALLTKAVETGGDYSYYFLAELEYRDDTSNAREESEVEGVRADGSKCTIVVDNKMRMILNLFKAAMANNENVKKMAEIELAKTLYDSDVDGYCWFWFESTGFLDEIGYEIQLKTKKCKIVLDDEMVIHLYKGDRVSKKLSKNSSDELKKIAREVIEEYAEEGEAAAQYYLGMIYAHKYEYSCSDSDKRLALEWLEACEDDVWAPNLDKTFKCLKRFIAVNWPPCDRFVGGSYVC